MTIPKQYNIALFDSVNVAMWAERILRKSEIPHKLIPVPRHISSDCGICIRFEKQFREDVVAALADKARYKEIRSL